MNPKRGVHGARSAANAGTIASSSGSASVAPAPRRNVRRGSAFWLKKVPCWSFMAGPQRMSPSVAAFLIWNGTLETMPSTIAENS